MSYDDDLGLVHGREAGEGRRSFLRRCAGTPPDGPARPGRPSAAYLAVRGPLDAHAGVASRGAGGRSVRAFGRGGDDVFSGTGGRDFFDGGRGRDRAAGSSGRDSCVSIERATDCEVRR